MLVCSAGIWRAWCRQHAARTLTVETVCYRLLRARIPVLLSETGGAACQRGPGGVIRMLLTWQYRCHPAISGAASGLFYGAVDSSAAAGLKEGPGGGAEGGVVDGVVETERAEVASLAPIAVFDTRWIEGANVSSGATNSATNSTSVSSSAELEVAAVSALVNLVLQERRVAPSAIAVLCLHAVQAQAIKRALSRHAIPRCVL